MSLTVDQQSRIPRPRRHAERAERPERPERPERVARSERESGWAAMVELARAESLENRRCTRRVRHEARDALGVVLFSAGASTLLSVVAALALSWAA